MYLTSFETFSPITMKIQIFYFRIIEISKLSKLISNSLIYHSVLYYMNIFD